MLAARASPTALGDVTNRAADSVPPVLPAGETPPESQQELECKPRRSVVAWRDPVAARPQVGHVQPAKQAAYDDYFLFGKAAEAIAADKSIKIGTVYNYLSEAVDRGLAYDWARFEEDLGGPHVFAAIKAALAAGRSRSDVRKVLDVEWWQISLVQAHTTRLALRDADAMAAQAAGADHAAAVEEPASRPARAGFAYAAQGAGAWHSCRCSSSRGSGGLFNCSLTRRPSSSSSKSSSRPRMRPLPSRTAGDRAFHGICLPVVRSTTAPGVPGGRGR